MKKEEKPPSGNESLQFPSELDNLRQVNPSEIFAIKQLWDQGFISERMISFFTKNIVDWKTQRREPLTIFEILAQTEVAHNRQINEMLVEGTVEETAEDQPPTIPDFKNMKKLGAMALIGAIDLLITGICQIEIHNSQLYFKIPEKITVELQTLLNNLCKCFDWKFEVNQNRIRIDFSPNSLDHFTNEEI